MVRADTVSRDTGRGVVPRETLDRSRDVQISPRKPPVCERENAFSHAVHPTNAAIPEWPAVDDRPASASKDSLNPSFGNERNVFWIEAIPPICTELVPEAVLGVAGRDDNDTVSV